MTHQEIINWHLEGDVSIQYQVYKYFFDEERFNSKSTFNETFKKLTNQTPSQFIKSKK
jgi:methylphosphotriester-DNA--protein-cysteine methyltransferase